MLTGLMEAVSHLLREEVGYMQSDKEAGKVGRRARNPWYQRGIGNEDILRSMHLTRAIHHSSGIRRWSHLTRSTRMPIADQMGVGILAQITYVTDARRRTSLSLDRGC